MKAKKVWTLLICFIIVAFVSYTGSFFTISETNSEWYNAVKSNLTPPNIVFPIVWTILYILIAFSMYFAWINTKKKDKKQKNKLILAFAINLMFNILWSIIFFGMKHPLAGFLTLIIIWLSTILCMIFVKKNSKLSFWLLIPYLLWLSFAGILNYQAI